MPLKAIDPLNGPAFALEGHVVTMDEAYTRHARGTVYVSGGTIMGVRPAGSPPPDGFAGVEAIATGGTIFPGLIELHNHLSYNVLPLWDVPKRFTNRDKWSSGAMAGPYRKLISGPMTVLGRTPGLVEAVVRYVECKCLLGGTTTSQGIALFSNNGISKYYEGIVRNVERTGEEELPQAVTRISDVEATDASRFLARLRKSSCLLLHLSEGTDEAAHEHFEALRLTGTTWAITPALAGIHCVALSAPDFRRMSELGAAMVWSPLSNLLLYGRTAKIRSAKVAGLRIGIGSDWSPSGSKNVLGELKVARAVDPEANVFSDRELVALATRNTAEILGWQSRLGTIEEGKRADLLVIADRKGDPYRRLLRTSERGIALVVINGVPRYGTPNLMDRFELGARREEWPVGGAKRVLFLKQTTANPIVGKLRLAKAVEELERAMDRLPALATELENPSPELSLAMLNPSKTLWSLQLDHDDPAGIAQRPHLPGPDGRPTAELPVDLALAATPLSQLLEPIELDRLTVADDGTFLNRLSRQPNLPEKVWKSLSDLY